jgi:hypothetical protein
MSEMIVPANTLIVMVREDDRVEVFEDQKHLLWGGGSIFVVIQRGIWWWKSFSIAIPVADTGAGGCNSGLFFIDVKPGFKTREEARTALKSGDFPYEYQ